MVHTADSKNDDRSMGAEVTEIKDPASVPSKQEGSRRGRLAGILGDKDTMKKHYQAVRILVLAFDEILGLYGWRM